MAGIHNAIIGTAQTFGPVPYPIQIITVGGGGGGGYGAYNGGLGYYLVGGGGSGSPVFSTSVTAQPGTGFTFTIGAGGIGGDGYTNTPASSGTPTTVSGGATYDSAFGGNGADVFSSPTNGGGGLGGDASYSSNYGAYSYFSPFYGGNGDVGISFGWPGGAGGGAGAASSGSSGISGTPVSGGDGGSPDSASVYDSLGNLMYFSRGGGGAGGGDDTAYPGSLGGNWGYANYGGVWDVLGTGYVNGGNADHFGDGGGGGSCNPNNPTGNGGNGYQGIAIVKYAGSQKGTGGDVIYSYGGYTYHWFISSGTFNP